MSPIMLKCGFSSTLFLTLLVAEGVPAGRAKGGALQPAAVPAAAQAHQAAARVPGDGEGQVGHGGGLLPGGLQHHADHARRGEFPFKISRAKPESELFVAVHNVMTGITVEELWTSPYMMTEHLY